MTKRYDDSIEVQVHRLEPVAFCWRGRRYSVQRLLKRWREAGEGWDPEQVRDHECFRVEARVDDDDGGIYDLRLDRLAGRGKPHWRLVRVWD